jgi:hypothetical protein
MGLAVLSWHCSHRIRILQPKVTIYMEANGQQDDTTDNPTQTMNSQNLPSQDVSTHATLPHMEGATQLPFHVKRTKMTNSPLDRTEDMEDTPLHGNMPIRNFVAPSESSYKEATTI